MHIANVNDKTKENLEEITKNVKLLFEGCLKMQIIIRYKSIHAEKKQNKKTIPIHVYPIYAKYFAKEYNSFFSNKRTKIGASNITNKNTETKTINFAL